MVKFGGEIGTLYQIFTPCTPLPKYKELNKHKVDAKHIKKKKADGDKEGENNEVEAVAE